MSGRDASLSEVAGGWHPDGSNSHTSLRAPCLWGTTSPGNLNNRRPVEVTRTTYKKKRRQNTLAVGRVRPDATHCAGRVWKKKICTILVVTAPGGVYPCPENMGQSQTLEGSPHVPISKNKKKKNTHTPGSSLRLRPFQGRQSGVWAGCSSHGGAAAVSPPSGPMTARTFMTIFCLSPGISGWRSVSTPLCRKSSVVGMLLEHEEDYTVVEQQPAGPHAA